MPDDKQQLAALVVQLQNGDGKAFEKIYNLTYKSAYFTALKITKKEEDAEDVLQNAYVKVLERINKLEKPESFSSWFNMMVANEAKDLMRKNKPELFTDNVISGGKDGDEEFSVFDTIEDDREEYTPGAGIEKDELQRDVMRLIENLDDEKRTAVLLYYYNNMTTKQISESLGISESTIKSRLISAKKELAKGVAELEKKNGKLLGVAPIPLVVWALRFASASAGTAFTASGAAAATFTAVTAAGTAAASAGSGAAVAAGTGVAAKIIAGVVVAGIVAGGAVAGTRAVKNRNKQTETTTAVTTEVRSTTVIGGFSRKTAEERYGDVTVPEGKDTDVLYAQETAKYGVKISYNDYAVDNGNDVTIVEATPIFSRNSFSATYDDLLPAAKANRKTYSKNIQDTVAGVNSAREDLGLGSLKTDNTLTEQANVRAEEIAWSGRDNAIRPDGSYYTTVFEQNGMTDGTRLEIIASGYENESDAIESITDNLLIRNSKVDRIGVGVAQDPETARLVYVVHLYSDESSPLDGYVSLQDYIKSFRDDALYDAAEEVTDEERIERIEAEVAKIPVVGDILLYDFDNDTQIMEFEQAVDRLAERIDRLQDSLR